MSFLEDIRKALSKSKPIAISKSSPDDFDRGWNTISDFSTSKSVNIFDSVYPNVATIASNFATVPIVLKRDDKPLDTHWVLDLFKSPSVNMSYYQLMYGISAGKLFMDNVYIRVHYKKGVGIPIGLSLLNHNRVKVDLTTSGELKGWIVGGTVKLSNSEVINISSYNPDSNVEGYSPTTASAKFATIEDLVAAYHKGLLNNNNVPAGMFVIRASREEFNNIKSKIKKEFGGANNFNKAGFVRKEPSSETALVEYVPYVQAKDTLDIDKLYSATDKKIEKAFRVPAELKGDVKNSTYASALVAEKIFIKYVLIPELTSVFDQINTFFQYNFSKQMNGAEITFDKPSISTPEEEKFAIESLKNKLEIYKEYADVVDRDVLIDVLGLPIGLIKASSTINSMDNGKAITTNQHQCVPTHKNIDPIALRDELSTELIKAIQSFSKEQRDRFLALLETSDSYEQAIDRMDLSQENKLALAVLLPIVYKQANKYQSVVGEQIISDASGISRVNMEGLVGDLPDRITDSLTNTLDRYWGKVVESFNGSNLVSLKDLVDKAISDNLTIDQFKDSVMSYYNDDYKARRLALTELNRINGEVYLDNMNNIAKNVSGIKIEKQWTTTSGSPCPICSALDGTIVDISESFWDSESEIEGEDGKIYKNTWIDNDVPQAHPHCECKFVPIFSEID